MHRLDRIEIRRNLANPFGEVIVRLVNDRAAELFVHRRIAGREEPQRLPQIPAGIVEIAGKPFEGIFRFVEPQIPLQRMGVKESNIVIAVRRRKSPRPAPRLGGEQDAAIVFLFDFAESGDDLVICHSPSSRLESQF